MQASFGFRRLIERSVIAPFSKHALKNLGINRLPIVYSIGLSSRMRSVRVASSSKNSEANFSHQGLSSYELGKGLTGCLGIGLHCSLRLSSMIRNSVCSMLG